jgi:hypothetical protein
VDLSGIINEFYFRCWSMFRHDQTEVELREITIGFHFRCYTGMVRLDVEVELNGICTEFHFRCGSKAILYIIRYVHWVLWEN